MNKQLLFSDEGRKAVARGIAQAARAVKVTLGPRGRNVILGKPVVGPRITNDGVSIVRDVKLPDPFEDVGVDLVKEVASKTNEGAGDGTTTSVVLFEAMVEGGLKHLAAGKNAMAIRRGMEVASKDIEEVIKKISKPISGKDDIRRIAEVSSESAELGKTIADTIEKVGHNGVVVVEESQGMETTLDIVDGMQTEKGYLSQYMVTNPEKMEAEHRDAFILVTDKVISNASDIVPVLEKVAQTGRRELVIVAEDVTGDALATIVVNKMRGSFSVLAVKTPGFGEYKKDMLQDLAVLVGADIFSEETGLQFGSVSMDNLGRASKVIATRDKTTFVGGQGDKESIESRVKQLHKQLEQTDARFDKDKLEQRIAKLTGGVALIKVGAATETEMKYLKDKIDDAVKATKASIEEGVVPGGGTALAHVAAKLLAKSPGPLSEDEAIGHSIVLRALDAPIKQILANCGVEPEEVNEILASVRKGKQGYNAVSGKIVEDMITEGILDPAKVARSAAVNATSAAAIFLTTEAVVVPIPEKGQEGA